MASVCSSVLPYQRALERHVLVPLSEGILADCADPEVLTGVTQPGMVFFCHPGPMTARNTGRTVVRSGFHLA